MRKRHPCARHSDEQCGEDEGRRGSAVGDGQVRRSSPVSFAVSFATVRASPPTRGREPKRTSGRQRPITDAPRQTSKACAGSRPPWVQIPPPPPLSRANAGPPDEGAPGVRRLVEVVVAVWTRCRARESSWRGSAGGVLSGSGSLRGGAPSLASTASRPPDRQRQVVLQQRHVGTAPPPRCWTSPSPT
jgi:hypothetical protein